MITAAEARAKTLEIILPKVREALKQIYIDIEKASSNGEGSIKLDKSSYSDTFINVLREEIGDDYAVYLDYDDNVVINWL